MIPLQQGEATLKLELILRILGTEVYFEFIVLAIKIIRLRIGNTKITNIK
jgi:hypothetical protein